MFSCSMFCRSPRIKSWGESWSALFHVARLFPPVHHSFTTHVDAQQSMKLHVLQGERGVGGRTTALWRSFR